MNKSSPLISLHHVVKKYQMGHVESEVVKQISLDVYEGEMLAIVGASGSGKSTLMNIIGLLDRAERGTYFLQGNDVADLSSDQLAALRNQCMGFVFQQFHLLPRLSAAQNVGLPLTYRDLPSAIIEQRVCDVLTRVGMQSFAAHCPTQLSGGQQQRIAIARALIGEPRVILADEPTGALDSQTGKEIMNLFLALHREGRTIIIVTHDEQIARECERRITLVDGRMITESKQ
jgi:putative ABC transport system ATP-binding protein